MVAPTGCDVTIRPDDDIRGRTLSLLYGWYTLYSPLPLYLPAWYPDLWPTTGTGVLMGILITGVAFRVATAFFPRLAADATLGPAEPTTKIEPSPDTLIAHPLGRG